MNAFNNIDTNDTSDTESTIDTYVETDEIVYRAYSYIEQINFIEINDKNNFDLIFKYYKERILCALYNYLDIYTICHHDEIKCESQFTNLLDTFEDILDEYNDKLLDGYDSF